MNNPVRVIEYPVFIRPIPIGPILPALFPPCFACLLLGPLEVKEGAGTPYDPMLRTYLDRDASEFDIMKIAYMRSPSYSHHTSGHYRLPIWPW